MSGDKHHERDDRDDRLSGQLERWDDIEQAATADEDAYLRAAIHNVGRMLRRAGALQGETTLDPFA